MAGIALAYDLLRNKCPLFRRATEAEVKAFGTRLHHPDDVITEALEDVSGDDAPPICYHIDARDVIAVGVDQPTTAGTGNALKTTTPDVHLLVDFNLAQPLVAVRDVAASEVT